VVTVQIEEVREELGKRGLLPEEAPMAARLQLVEDMEGDSERDAVRDAEQFVDQVALGTASVWLHCPFVTIIVMRFVTVIVIEHGRVMRPLKVTMCLSCCWTAAASFRGNRLCASQLPCRPKAGIPLLLSQHLLPILCAMLAGEAAMHNAGHQASAIHLMLKVVALRYLQLADHEVLEEARGRQVEVPLNSDGRAELLDDVLAELRHLYGNVNTLFIHADKQGVSCPLQH
jgi:hypothetical protein